MGTTVRYPLNAGPEGADVTTANSGASVVNKTGTSPYVRYAAAAKGSGSTYGVEASTTSGNALVRLLADAPSTTMAISLETMIPQTQPTENFNLATIRNDQTSGFIGSIFWSTTGKVLFQDSPHTYTQVAAAGVLSFGVMYRFEILLVGGTTTAGSVKINVYTLTGSTPVASLTLGNANLSTFPITGLDMGNTGGVTSTQISRFANVQMESGRTTEIGKYNPGANTPPTVNAGSDKSVALNSTVSLNGTATDSDGSIISTVWTVDSYPSSLSAAPTLTGANTLAASFPASAPGVYVIRLTAIDNSNNSTASVVTVYVPSSSATVRRTVDNSGGWTVTGAATASAALSDTSAATYVESPASPSNPAARTDGFNPLNPLSGATLVLSDTSLSGSGALLVKVELIETVSGIVRKTWSNVSAGGDISLALSPAECATITTAGWQDLSVRTTVQAA